VIRASRSACWAPNRAWSTSIRRWFASFSTGAGSPRSRPRSSNLVASNWSRSVSDSAAHHRATARGSDPGGGTVRPGRSAVASHAADPAAVSANAGFRSASTPAYARSVRS
jgi:hypothetical protein